MNKKTILILPTLVALSIAIGILIGNMLSRNSQPVFSGSDEEWGDWSFGAKAVFTSLDWGVLIAAAEAEVNAMA